MSDVRTRPIESATVLRLLRNAVDTVPDDVFLDFAGEVYTFSDVDRLSTRQAHALAQQGLRAGDTLVTILDNNVDCITLWLAANKLGAIWVPINTSYTGEFLRHQVSDSLAKIVVCEAQYLPRLIAVAPELSEVSLILVRGDHDSEPSGNIRLELLDKHRGSDESPIADISTPGRICLLLYTSGTTGPSKACMVSHNYICNQARQSNIAVVPLPGEVMWTCLPLFHGAAIDTTLSALLAKSRIAIASRFSVSSFWAEIERSGAGNARLMATIFPLLAQAPDSPEMQRCFGQLRAVTGVPISPDVRRIWKERFGVKIVNSFAYGQSEGSRLSMSVESDPTTPPESSCGPIADDYDVQIVDDEDNALPDGTTGEIVFRPRRPHVMFAGYWRRPDDTTHAWRNLWMHTGDLGKVEGGYLYFVDRKKDYLRSRGENISSFEVESALYRHPDVAEVAVHSAKAGSGEDELKATVVLKDGSALTERDLCLWCLDNVPYFAVPRFIEFRTSLWKTPTGKIMKFQMREEGRTANTWDRVEAGIEVRRR